MNKKLIPHITICDAIAKLFYPNVEVVLHDVKEERLVHISNTFSKREIGDKMINDVKDFKTLTTDIIGPYEKINFDGKKLKTVSSIVRDENNEIIGIMCINFDIQIFENIFDSLKSFLNIEDKNKSPNLLFSQDWKSHTNKLIKEFLELKEKKIEELKIKQKKELILFLNNKGIFSIRNVVSYLCKTLSISRATIYKWLKQEN
ncbi:hypothetical protein CRV00_11655 [Malaciobacter molluscorum]|uniref:helix-turn-helix transcriptional regulator n=1 Tax=Malaciobacter molluscorum TaxID=1032072 RepID=UPI00100BAED5|nr:PAS domain-containing protein [Malaciobacter molluscorum]RXJ93302.1 hypothetical protein CRV00_11655 [Malaciobacter molluscorum]